MSLPQGYLVGKVLFLDGLVQTTEKDEFFYHEMLVHPPMMTHPEPRKVLVIGGGDGGCVREILKHRTVESVDVVEIDELVVEASLKYLPTISSKMKDKRVKIIYEDGIKYVRKGEKKYDVVIIDSTDPVGCARGLFEKPFYEDLFKSLTEYGVMCEQTGSPFFSPKFFKEVQKNIKSSGFKFVMPYIYPIPSYPGGLWSFTLASKFFNPLDIKTEERLKDIKTKYYDKDVHTGIFLITPMSKIGFW